MSKLNPEQQLAANFRDGVCAVVAVPGSGKTKTMLERIGVLVGEYKIPPENILGLTFTRNAADEMRNRLVPVLGDLSTRVFLATIHSFCHTVLKDEGFVFEILFGKEQFILNLNYRSTPQILKACQNLIQHNIRQIHKTLETHNPAGDDVIVLESSSEETEAISVVNEINDLIKRKDFVYKDLAVLYRCNFQSRVIEEAFLEHKIPYHIENGLSFYDRREVKILLDYLRVIVNPESEASDEALPNILNVPNRYIGRKFIQELNQYSFKRDSYLYPALQSMPIKLPYIRVNVKEFIKFMDPLIEDADNMEPSDLINLLRVNLDYDRFITDEDIPSPDDVKIYLCDQHVTKGSL
ncbi:3'-5' exonuclease [Thermodesulfobacteriota bacterium]